MQNAARQSHVQKTVNSVPCNYSDGKAGTVKVDEWQNLSTILPISSVCGVKAHHILRPQLQQGSVVSLITQCFLSPWSPSLACTRWCQVTQQHILNIWLGTSMISSTSMLISNLTPICTWPCISLIFYTFLALFNLGGVSLPNGSLVRSKDYSVTINSVFWFGSLLVVSKFLTHIIHVKWNWHYFTPFSGLGIWNAGWPNQTVPP